MRYELRLAKINSNMNAAAIECIYATPGSALKVGDKLCDISVDLSSGFSQYCPPISYFRMVVREKVWLQKILVAPGDNCDVGQLLAVFSSEQADPGEEGPVRPLRITTAGINHHSDMWSAGDR
jgi:hypothetical protein